MKSTLFSNVPVDPDTRILRQKEMTIESIPVLIQRWAWEGIVADSAIFHDADVLDVDDNKLFKIIEKYYDVGENIQYTVKRNQNGNTFVNFNFSYY